MKFDKDQPPEIRLLSHPGMNIYGTSYDEDSSSSALGLPLLVSMTLNSTLQTHFLMIYEY